MAGTRERLRAFLPLFVSPELRPTPDAAHARLAPPRAAGGAEGASPGGRCGFPRRLSAPDGSPSFRLPPSLDPLRSICYARDYVAEWELCRTGHDELAFSPQHNLLHSQRAKEGHQPLVRLPRAIRSGLRGIAKRHRLGLQLDIDPRLARSCLTRYDQHPCRDRPRYEGPGHRSLRCREAGPRRPWKDKPGLTSFLKSL